MNTYATKHATFIALDGDNKIIDRNLTYCEAREMAQSFGVTIKFEKMKTVYEFISEHIEKKQGTKKPR